MTTISRGIVSFAWTYFAAEWIAKVGAELPFGIFGMLMGVFARESFLLASHFQSH